MKILLKRIYKLLMNLFYVFWAIMFRTFCPIKRNRILFWSYNYKKVSCNPYYISKYLSEKYGEEIEIYWALNKKNVKYNAGFNFVYWKSLKYLYILYTSKVIVTNMRILPTSFFYKKKKQVYIQTWHSSMRLKMIEQDAIDTLPTIYKIMAKFDSQQCSYILAGSRFSSETFKRAFWLPDTTKILEYGTPRNDYLLNVSSEEKEKIKRTLKIDDALMIIMYAPTFRSDYSTDSYIHNFKEIIDGFSTIYHKKCVCLLRLHPNFLLLRNTQSYLISDDIIDVTTYNDMQELLAITDILLTDYSSAMFDFALTGKPCFIYASDYKIYDRGTYFKLEDLPFPYSTNEGELIEQISIFNIEDYNCKIASFNQEEIGSFEKGTASQLVSKHIINIINSK